MPTDEQASAEERTSTIGRAENWLECLHDDAQLGGTPEEMHVASLSLLLDYAERHAARTALEDAADEAHFADGYNAEVADWLRARAKEME